MKRCSRCKLKKPLSDFWSNRSTKDGYCVYCRECMTKRYEPLKQKQCALDGCQRISATAKYCAQHRRQQASLGYMSPIPVRTERIRVTGPGTKCLVDDCARQVHSRGMCVSHYALYKNGKPVTSLNEPVPCIGCSKSFTRKDRRQVYCTDCRTISQKMRSYGLTAADWFQMLADQDERCAICAAHQSQTALHVDHDHDCCPGDRACGNCVRGLLCQRCNLGLGAFADDLVLLVSATVYLQRYGRQYPPLDPARPAHGNRNRNLKENHMEFAAPSTGGGSLRPADVEGHLLVVEPLEHVASIATSFGEKDAIRVTVHDINTQQTHENVLLFGTALIGSLKGQIGKRVLGVMGRGTAKPGQAAPWVLNDASGNADAVKAATAYLTGQVAQTIAAPEPVKASTDDALAAALGNLAAAGLTK